jgi:FMN phosphatase YigB (HAD superfamily)
VAELVFLLDVDNTLIDNDQVKADTAAKIEQLVGPERAARFWAGYEEVRREHDYVDIVRTLQRFWAAFPEERSFPQVAALVLYYPYETCLYPGALEAVAHLKTLGTAAILSDGDPVFQPAKIARTGLAAAVDSNVLIYVHKEAHLDEVTRRFRAERYVLVDDKPRILAAAKLRLGERLVTVHVSQGHYAHADERAAYPAADVELAAIADLRRLGRDDFRPRAR